jgi:hypothetical protein
MPRFTTFGDVLSQLPYVDDPDVLRKAESNQALELALRLSRPVNWWGTGLKPEQLLPVAEEGIPDAWLPSPAILKGLVDAKPGKRIALLMSHAEEIVDNCRFLIGECYMISNTSFIDRKPLLLRALDTFEAGYYEAAMALAVNVAEGLALWASRLFVGVLPSIHGSIDARLKLIDHMRKHQKYGLAAKELDSGILDHGMQVSRRALLSPIPRFFLHFDPDGGDAVPDTLSRHAVAHRPTVEHYSQENALLAIMLATSLIREHEDHCEWPDPEDPEDPA